MIPPVIAFFLPAPADVDVSGQKELSTSLWVGVALIIAPVFETLVLQFAPARLAEKWALSGWKRYALMILPFAAVHVVPAVLLPSLVNGLGGGYTLGLCYFVCMTRSHKHAVLATAAVHALHNCILLLFSLFDVGS